MRYMLVETYLHGPAPVYARFAERGRMLPDGVVHIESWIDADSLDRCFQLMEAEQPELLDRWMANWRDLVAFEVVPVVDSAEAAARSRAEPG